MHPAAVALAFTVTSLSDSPLRVLGVDEAPLLLGKLLTLNFWAGVAQEPKC